MNWFVHTHDATDAGRSQQSKRSHDATGLIGKYVTKHIFGENNIEIPGPLHQRHRGRVDIHVRELHAGIILRATAHHFTPQPGAFENIRLIDGENFLPPPGGKVESDAGDTFDGWLTVGHRIDRNAVSSRASNGARLS